MTNHSLSGRLSDVERRSLLTWVIVGGGPTGSELAAEMHDLARSKEFNKRYPKLAPQVQIKLMDAAPAILTTFDESLSKYAAKKFKRDVSRPNSLCESRERLKLTSSCNRASTFSHLGKYCGWSTTRSSLNRTAKVSRLRPLYTDRAVTEVNFSQFLPVLLSGQQETRHPL